MNVLISCSRSESIGLGHFSRMLAIRKSFLKRKEFNTFFSIHGEKFLSSNLKELDLEINISERDTSNFFNKVIQFINANDIKLIILDMHKSADGPDLLEFLIWAKAKNIILIAVDSLINYAELLDHIWLPSIFFDQSKVLPKEINCEISYGWNQFLLLKTESIKNWLPGNNVLVLSGGADVLGLGNWLPKLLDAKLKPSSIVSWVKGPYANAPILPINTRLKWKILDNQQGLDKLIIKSNYILTLFGVSFFESINYGIPTVVVPLSKSKNINELKIIQNEKVALVGKDMKVSVNILKDLMDNDKLANKISNRARQKMHGNGCDLFINKITKIVAA